ncbi:MAG TPA: hypothetical protein PLU95_11175, partial [Syntrophales bacterium]|nr:hypothetical protein [Syntrophales bacterium]HPN09856.1 hypothetical protein [Syntrophales bacterium]
LGHPGMQHPGPHRTAHQRPDQKLTAGWGPSSRPRDERIGKILIFKIIQQKKPESLSYPQLPFFLTYFNRLKGM